MSEVKEYIWWKQVLFWGMWVLLLLPAYCAAFGAWLIGSMLPDYHDPVDITLTIIMTVTLLGIMIIAVYTFWHFRSHSRSFVHLMVWLSVGLFVVPLVSGLGAVFSYVQLTGHVV